MYVATLEVLFLIKLSVRLLSELSNIHCVHGCSALKILSQLSINAHNIKMYTAHARPHTIILYHSIKLSNIKTLNTNITWY